MPLNRITRYVLALGILAVATGVRVLINPLVGSATLTHPTVFTAVLIAAWYCGTGPALVDIVLGYIGIEVFLFHAPFAGFVGVYLIGRLALYLSLNAIILLFVRMLRNDRHRLESALRQQKKAEQALQQSERRWATTLESIGDGVIATDLEGRITFMNAVAQELTGWTLAEAQAQPIATVFSVISAQTRERVENPADRALREGRVVGLANHTILIRKDGTEIPIDDSGAPIRGADGTAMGVVLVFRDISERRQGEERLRLRNERMALLSETAAQLLGAQDPNKMVLELFERVSSHLNVQAYFNFMVEQDGNRLRLDSFAGIPDRAARLISHLEFGQAICGTVAQTRQRIHATNVQTSGDPKVELIRRYGIRAYCCHPLMAGDRLLGTLSFGSRVVDRFEDEEVDFMRTICHYVAIAKERLRLERELHERISQLAEADVRKNEFLAMLAHELRNPLAAISSAIQFLRMRGPADPLLQRARDAAERQAGHMTSLLDDLLDVSRVTQGKVTLKKSDVALVSAVESAVDATIPLIKEKEHRFNLSVPQEPLILNADPVRLTQVVSNLLHNAAKYTPAGGEIDVSVECHDGQAVIRVRDNGVGIEPKLLPYIFDLFVQSDRSPDRAQGGLGIGLTLVRSLVEMHGGHVEAHSDGAGKGSEFIVRLPCLRN